MAWVAVDKDKGEWLFNEKPHKVNWYEYSPEYRDVYIELPIGSVKKLIGRDLTFDDDPVELK